MALKISAPKTKVFILDDVDKEFGNEGDPTQVTIAQATEEQDRRRASLYEEVRRISEPDGSQVWLQKFSPLELRQRESWLVLRGANIVGPDDQPLFPSREDKNGPRLDMTQSNFEKAWGMLPSQICAAIHKRVLEMNPHWDFAETEGEES